MQRADITTGWRTLCAHNDDDEEVEEEEKVEVEKEVRGVAHGRVKARIPGGRERDSSTAIPGVARGGIHTYLPT